MLIFQSILFFLIEILLNAVSIMLVVAFHEFTKAAVSTKFGDEGPKKEGRLTLNPFKHFEPIGFMLFLIFGYGWGKPVKTSALYYKDRRKNTVVTYTVPIVVSLILGILFQGIYFLINTTVTIDVLGQYAGSWLIILVGYIARNNIALALFNILPVYPLDGYKIFTTVLSRDSVIKLTQYENLLQIILMVCLCLNLFDYVFTPLVNLILLLTNIIFSVI